MTLSIGIILGLICSANGQPSDASQDRAAELQAELQSLLREYFEEKASGTCLRWGYYAPRFMRLAEQDSNDAVAYNALFWLTLPDAVAHAEFPRAMDLLIKHHAQNEDLGELSRYFVSPVYFASASGQVEKLLRKAMEINPDRDVQAAACFNLAQFFKNKADLARQLQRADSGGLAERVERSWGRPYLESMRNTDPEKLTREAVALLDRGHREYQDFWRSHLVSGQQAPEIEGMDIDGNVMRLSQYRGRVVVLSFWGFGCLPCRALLPHERSLVKRLAGEPFVLLGVNNDLNLEEVRKEIKRERITWRSWWDGGDSGNSIAQAWQVRIWPSLYVLDREGVIRYRGIYDDALDVVVDSLLLEAVDTK